MAEKLDKIQWMKAYSAAAEKIQIIIDIFFTITYSAVAENCNKVGLSGDEKTKKFEEKLWK